MKIYYTTDGTIDDNLEQLCPFKEKHNFEGYKENPIKYVGCVGCHECKYCYGGKWHGKYGLLPYSKDNKQFMLIPIRYVKCSLCFNEKTRNSKFMRLRCWIWRNFAYPIKRRLIKNF